MPAPGREPRLYQPAGVPLLLTVLGPKLALDGDAGQVGGRAGLKTTGIEQEKKIE